MPSPSLSPTSRKLRRLRIGISTLVLFAGLGALPAWAQTAGAPIKLLVGFPPGGGTDAVARLLAEKLKDQLGVPIVVENRAGAGGQIAAQALKAAAPDGHTLMLSHDHAISILPQVVKNAGYNPEQDFVAVAGFATFANALAVSGGTPAKSMKEYTDWLRKAGQGKGSIGVPAPASIPEFLVKLIGEKYKLNLQAVPYRGSAPMMTDMLGNQINAGVASIPDFIENQKAGKLRVVAVIGSKRQAVLPNVPTFSELGFNNLDDLPYYGIFAPTGTPPAVLNRYADAIAKVIAQPEIKTQLTNMGMTVEYVPPGQFAGRVRSYTHTWESIIKSTGFVAQ